MITGFNDHVEFLRNYLVLQAKNLQAVQNLNLKHFHTSKTVAFCGLFTK